MQSVLLVDKPSTIECFIVAVLMLLQLVHHLLPQKRSWQYALLLFPQIFRGFNVFVCFLFLLHASLTKKLHDGEFT